MKTGQKGGKLAAPIAAKKAVQAKTKAPAPRKDTLREAFAEVTTLNLELVTANVNLREIVAATKESRDMAFNRSVELGKEGDELRKISSALKVEQENLRAMLEHQQRANISLRAEMEVARARGYIAGMKGEPFDRPARQETGGQLMAATRQPLGDEEDRHMTVLEKERRRRPLGDFVT